MNSSPLQPVVSDIADIFTWKTTKSIASNSTTNNANHASDQVKVLGNAFFCFVAWRGSTNYDSIAGQFKATGINSGNYRLYSPAIVPNNFTALVKRNNRFSMMDQAMPQGALCSSGYLAGNQVPWPVLYPPNTVFNIDLYNTAPVVLTATNQSTVIPLRIDFGLFGYNVPLANLRIFLDSWPELYGKAINVLTKISLPRLPS
jgi:hypothetical protein